MSHLDTLEDTPQRKDGSGEASETDWAAALSPRRPVTRRVQVFLAALVVAALGFLGGIITTHQVEESQQSSDLPGGVELPEGMELPEGVQLPSGGMPDAGQLAALTGGSTTYTVTVVDGSTLYLEDTNGSTVKVVTLPTTEVRHLARGTTTDLRPGDTVTVTGDADDTGTILADAVDQTE